MNMVSADDSQRSGLTFDQLVQKYVQLRDKKAEHEKRKVDIDEMMKRIEGFMRLHMESNHLQSARTAFGTATLADRTSCTVSDWTAALEYIRSHEAWDMLEARVSKNAIKDMINETGTIVPGVDFTVTPGVNVRRAAPDKS
jgi:hypothetical protein